MFVKFWGVHGSLPRPGASTLKYGGNTACVEVRCGETLIIFDAGTGIRELGEDLVRRNCPKGCNKNRITGHIFFSHVHWDHVQGFPFFDPIFKPGNEFHLYGSQYLNCTIQSVMKNQMSPPNFPVSLEDLEASVHFHDLKPGDSVTIDGIKVRPEKLNHPGGSLGYRLEQNHKALVYASDTECLEGIDASIIALASDCDLLIFDGMYTPEQYCGSHDDLPRKSWGHSTWESAVELADLAKVKRLVLFHHGNNDEVVAEIEARAKKLFPQTTAAYEGLEISL